MQTHRLDAGIERAEGYGEAWSSILTPTVSPGIHKGRLNPTTFKI